MEKDDDRKKNMSVKRSEYGKEMDRMKGKRAVCTYLLLAGFFIHSLNQPVVSSSQPSTPVLQAKEIAFTWLYLHRDMMGYNGQKNVPLSTSHLMSASLQARNTVTEILC